MVEEICDKLGQSIDNLFIQRITKNEEMFLISLSDKYGNDMDMLPLGFDSETGNEVVVDYDYDYSGVDYTIPDKYKTYRNIIYDRLMEETPESIIDELGQYGISYPINALYTEYISDLSISELYAVCNYMVYTIAMFCNDEEKAKFISLLNNDMISSFIRMPNSEKLLVAKDYYYIPKYINNVLTLSNKLLVLAMNKKAGKEINTACCMSLKEKILSLITDAKEKLLKETDCICNIKALKGLLGGIKSNIEIEFMYCLGLSDEISERMKNNEEYAFIQFGSK